MTSIARDTAGRLADRIKQTVAERGQTYGTPEENFANTAALWNAYLVGRLGISLVNLNAFDVGQLMALLKIARLLEAPTHEDSALDAAAFIMLGHGCAVDASQRAVGQEQRHLAYFTRDPLSGKIVPVDRDKETAASDATSGITGQIGPVGTTCSAGGIPYNGDPAQAGSGQLTAGAATLNNGGVALPLTPTAEDDQQGAPFTPASGVTGSPLSSTDSLTSAPGTGS